MAETEATPEGQPEEQEDELKRKFREALDRKRKAQEEANSGRGVRGSSKVQGHSQSAKKQKSFRRKSG